MLLKPDDILGNRLRLERLIGEGGMGSVWCAYDLRENQRVALKFLRGSGSESSLKRFFREARTAIAIAHPNVVRVHEVLVGPDGMPIMVMDYLEGESLGARLEREQKLPLEETVRIVSQVLGAIGSAHARGVVHRDLKPDNIFLCAGGPSANDVRVLDFGVAKLTAEKGEAMATAGLTATGAVIGTPYYMSPEQVFADKTIDHRADIWSLGIILYECLSGKKPIGGESIGALLRSITNGDMPPLRSVEPGLPEPIYALVDRMISVDREKRPKDLREVFEVVSAFSPVRRIIPFGEATGDASFSYDDTIPAEMMSLQQTNDGITSAQSTSTARPRSSLPLIALVAALVGGGTVIGGVAWRSNHARTTGTPGVIDYAPPPSAAGPPTIISATASAAPVAGSSTPFASASSSPGPRASSAASVVPVGGRAVPTRPHPSSSNVTAITPTTPASVARPAGTPTAPAIFNSNPYEHTP